MKRPKEYVRVRRTDLEELRQAAMDGRHAQELLRRWQAQINRSWEIDGELKAQLPKLLERVSRALFGPDAMIVGQVGRPAS